MKRVTQTSITIAAAITAILFAFTVAKAEKPPNTGGGGGGNTAAYAIVPFMPPGSTSTGSGVADINESGQAVGVLDYANGVHEAIHLDIETNQYTALSGGTYATGINNLNEIVGADSNRGLFWMSPSAQPLLLSPLPGDSVSWAAGINDDGIIIGESAFVLDDVFVSVPVVWSVYLANDLTIHVDGPKSLPPLHTIPYRAWDINQVAAGVAQVAGESDSEAVVWTIEQNADGTLVDPNPPVGLGALDEPNSFWSEGRGINDLGDVCGQSGILPFVVLAGQAPEPLSVPRRLLNGEALELNDVGEIVGLVSIQPNGTSPGFGPGIEYAYLWNEGERVDLTAQLPQGSGWDRLRRATAINNTGLIGGVGIFDVPFRGFILFPNSP